MHVFPLAHQRNAGQGRLILEGFESQTMAHHSRWDSFGRVIGPSQRTVPDSTRHSQETHTSVPPTRFAPVIRDAIGRRPSLYYERFVVAAKNNLRRRYYITATITTTTTTTTNSWSTGPWGFVTQIARRVPAGAGRVIVMLRIMSPDCPQPDESTRRPYIGLLFL